MFSANDLMDSIIKELNIELCPKNDELIRNVLKLITRYTNEKLSEQKKDLIKFISDYHL